MANREACELYIEQEIKDSLEQGKKPYSIGRELSAWVEKLFEVTIKPKTIESRAYRQREITSNEVKESQDTESTTDSTPDIIKDRQPQGGGKREGAGRPRAYKTSMQEYEELKEKRKIERILNKKKPPTIDKYVNDLEAKLDDTREKLVPLIGQIQHIEHPVNFETFKIALVAFVNMAEKVKQEMGCGEEQLPKPAAIEAPESQPKDAVGVAQAIIKDLKSLRHDDPLALDALEEIKDVLIDLLPRFAMIEDRKTA